MKFGYAIFYVDDVEAALAFYERAFGLEGKVLAPGEYGELQTGGTRLGFSRRDFAESLTTIRVQAGGLSRDPAPVEIGLVTDDVDGAFQKALKAGAVPVKAPETKPWGQRVGYVRDSNGFLVELCSAV